MTTDDETDERSVEERVGDFVFAIRGLLAVGTGSALLASSAHMGWTASSCTVGKGVLLFIAAVGVFVIGALLVSVEFTRMMTEAEERSKSQ